MLEGKEALSPEDKRNIWSTRWGFGRRRRGGQAHGGGRSGGRTCVSSAPLLVICSSSTTRLCPRNMP
eukprot:scaffold7549_cov111-Isochrysis_galbana.AAC.3